MIVDGRVVTPCLGELALLLGVEDDLSKVFTAKKINPWALYQPSDTINQTFKHPVEVVGEARARCPYTLRYATALSQVPSLDSWKKSISAKRRLGDFRGYYHNARPIISSFVYVKTVNKARKGEFTFSFKFNSSPTKYELGLSTLGFTELRLGAYIVNQKTNKSLFIVNTLPLVYNGILFGYITGDVSSLPFGDYWFYPLLCDVDEIAGGTYRYNRLYSLPVVGRQGFVIIDPKITCRAVVFKTGRVSMNYSLEGGPLSNLSITYAYRHSGHSINASAVLGEGGGVIFSGRTLQDGVYLEEFNINYLPQDYGDYVMYITFSANGFNYTYSTDAFSNIQPPSNLLPTID